MASITEAYPAFAPLASIPDVKKVLDEGTVKGWTADQFVGHLMGTNWWRTTSQSQRNWIGKQLGDPAEATRQSNQQAYNILTTASNMGINLSLADAASLANDSLAQGWDNNRLNAEIVGHANAKTDRAGTITATQTTLTGIGAQQGLTISKDTAFQWASNIASGKASQAGFEEYVRQQAVQQHPYWQKQLQEGMTVRQLADPYLQRAGQTLEISPDSIDLSDPKWDFVKRDTKGGQTPMSQSEWNTHLMRDPKFGWEKTDNAKVEAYNVVDQLQKSFGNAPS